MKRIFTVAAFGLSLLVASGGACFAQDLEKADAAYNSGEYATALRELRYLAERGNADAQFRLGVMYEEGKGDIQDYAQALKWYVRAALQDDGDAQYNIGQMYYNGRGVAQDYAEAVKWYKLAVGNFSEAAMLRLGMLYSLESTGYNDRVHAHMWLNIAAITGDELAIKLRDNLSKIMTTADVDKAQQLARACVAKKYKGC